MKILVAAFAAVALVACQHGASGDGPEETGTIALTVGTAPANVACLRITVTISGGSDVRTLALTPGSSVAATLQGFGLGSATVKAEAFPGACATLTSASLATWVSEPVTVMMVAGQVVPIGLVMQMAGQIGISVSWSVDGGAPDAPAPTCTDAVRNGTETDVDCGGTCAAKCAVGKLCMLGADCQSATCSAGVCRSATCTDGVRNGGEVDVDCGGASCPRCDDGRMCVAGSDCRNGVCPSAALICAAASCSDAVKNGAESDADCGGSCPGRCADGRACGTGSDCANGVCSAAKVCVSPVCTDAVKNGTETDVDCGGSCTAKCGAGKACGTSGANCASGVCTAGFCQPATCNDGVRNGSETDLNCGGSCAPCANTRMCVVAVDCASGVCTAARCAAPVCTDGVKNGSETDVNCGGASCPKCADGKVCIVAGDCTSGVCSNGRCAAPSCSDGVKNGSETDVNCGGSCAPTQRCANGKGCLVGADCLSGVCTAGACAPAP